MTGQYSKEIAFLLRAASPHRTQAPVDQGIDFESLRRLAEFHRLIPLLHWELTRLAPGAIPDSIEHGYRESIRNSMLLTRELVRTLDWFHKAGIQALPFKGPTLAITAYRNITLRSFDDLDILIHPRDLWKARDLLAAERFTSKVQLSAWRQPDFLDAYDELVMYGPGSFPLIELHWAFVPPHFSIPLDLAACWPRRKPLTIGNREIASLHPEDLLLVLAIHGSKHCWSHLGLVTDVAWFIENQPFETASVLAAATKLGIRRMLLLGAALSRSLLKATLPEAFINAIAADREIPQLILDIQSALFGERHDESSVRANTAMHLRMRERLTDRLRYSLKLTFRPGLEDWEVVDLPGPLRYLYPLLRFPRLALKYAGRKND